MQIDPKPSKDQTGVSDRLLRRLDSVLPSLVAELNGAHALINTHEDADKILGGLVAAIVSQEMTVMAIEDRSMVVGDSSSIAKDQLIRDWRALTRHYVNTKYEAVFDNGANQLSKLTEEEARQVILQIRQFAEPLVNEVMGHTESSIKLEIPLLGPIKLRLLGWVKGPRAGLRRFQGRVIRVLIQGSLWLSVAFWAIHWASWTLFDAPYLADNYELLANITRFLLLGSTTFIVWVLLRAPRPRRGARRILGGVLASGAWLIIGAGWVHWVAALMFEIPSGIPVLDAIHKLALVFFLASGSLAAWVSGRIFRRSSDP